MTRQEALAAGESTYFTGKPCKHGHVAARYVLNWTCVDCHARKCAENQPKWRAKNADKCKKYSEKYAEKHNNATKLWRKVNRDKCAEQQRQWNAANREKRNLYSKEWRQQNSGAMNALKAKRRSDILQRTPVWLSADDKRAIRKVYDFAKLRAKMTGVPHHVDHVVPLRGECVSGLHVPWNLQVIPAQQNMSKGNKHE
jgi:hypothetical protein